LGLTNPELTYKPWAIFITKPKAKSGNYQKRESPMLHMLKLKHLKTQDWNLC